MKVFDSVIIGGGFAGLSAGIYLARYMRSALIIDSGYGRWNTKEINENYLGFPESIPARELRKRGLKQALKFGVKCKKDKIDDIKSKNGVFVFKGQKEEYLGKTVILATGVKDLWPEFNDWQSYIGKSLFWCITCDGYKTLGKKVVIIGQTNEAATTAMQFLAFTNQITFVTNVGPGKDKVSKRWREILNDAKIPFCEGKINRVFGKNGQFKKIILDTGVEIPLDMMFNQQGALPNIDLAKKLGVKLDGKGYIMTDNEQRTNIPLVFAAGDVTRPFSHQIITAAHEGATAATTANYELYPPKQKED